MQVHRMENFNTKFVIAKFRDGGYEAHFFKEFQYKICYSKINTI